MSFFDNHSHTYMSNIRLIDSTNSPIKLIKTAKDLGLAGIAITDHEALSSHVIVNKLAKELHETDPDFTIALGNEIYLTETRDKGQKYYHFILIAKDAAGYKILRKLSSLAWYNMYEDRRLERVPTLKSDLERLVKENPGHLIATTACIGGELGSLIMAEKETKESKREQILGFLNFCKDLFGDDFYIECAPASSSDQIYVNKHTIEYAKELGIKMSIGSDAHYLRKEDRQIHKAYLTSKDGDREVDSFYEYTYLMNEEEATQQLLNSYDGETIQWIFNNSLEIKNKIEYFSLERKQIIPKVEVTDYPAIAGNPTGYAVIDYLLQSDNVQERYWINECLKSLKDKKLDGDAVYMDRINLEADVIKYIGEKLDDCLFAYFNTFKHYIHFFWDCGSIVGPGRGSSTGFLTNYLLGITQLDPIRWKLPYYRFLNKERAELPKLNLYWAVVNKEREPA